MKRLPVLVLALLAFAAGDQNLFTSPTAGFTMRKPDSWVYLTVSDVAENRGRIRLNDKELEEAIRQRASLPLVVAARYPEPHDSLNPTVQVGVRPLGQLEGKPATELLSMVMAQLQAAFADFQYVARVSEAKVSGLPAASMVATYTMKTEAGSFPVKSRMWLVPRGPVLFIIGMSGAQEGKDLSEEEFKQIFDSIVIEQ